MKAFGTRPTYQIFAVVTLVTGIIYFVFNVAYLKKRPQLEGNDIVKKKPKTINVKSSEKHTNDINLEEKPQLKEIEKKTEDNLMKNDGIDNGGFLKESSTETNEQNSTQMEAIRNAKNVDKTNTAPINQHEKKSMRKSDATHVKNKKSNACENSFTNPNFETDKSDQCEITVESQRVDDKRVD